MCVEESCPPFMTTLIYFRTIKLVQIRNWKLGLCHRLVQLVIFLYVILYVLLIEKGYNGRSSVEGYTYIKVKGSAQQYQPSTNSSLVWDSIDIVSPPMESNAVFLTTNSFTTYQQSRGTWVDPSLPCVNSTECTEGQSSEWGFNTGNCITWSGDNNTYCEINGWGPVEVDPPPTQLTILNEVQNFTIFIRSSVVFTSYDIQADNLGNGSLIFGYNEWTVAQIVEATNFTFDQVAVQGCILAMTIEWNCIFNFWDEKCDPTFDFFRIDQSNDFSNGFNYRYGDYYYLSQADGSIKEYRDLYKVYGIRLVILLAGAGEKFSIIPLMLNIASGLALLAIATIISDLLALYIIPHHKDYRSAKIKAITPELYISSTNVQIDENTPINVPYSKSD